jgi:predicted nucleotidyltransferase
MRLSKSEQQVIKQSISVFDKEAKVVLFGSRTKDAARGGDIDLLIISDNIKQQHLGQIRWKLWEKLGEQKIDLVLSKRHLSDTFVRIVFEQGEVL